MKKRLLSAILILSIMIISGCAKNNDDDFDETSGEYKGEYSSQKTNNNNLSNNQSNNSDNPTSSDNQTNVTNNQKPDVEKTEDVNELDAFLDTYTTRITTATKPFYLNAKIKSGSPKTTKSNWSSSNKTVVSISNDGKITPHKEGYSDVILKLVRTDNPKLTYSISCRVIVFADEKMVNVSNKSGTLVGELNKPLAQQFDIDEKTGDIYYLSSTKSTQNITIRRVAKDGTKDTMKLNAFGHGYGFAVERYGNDLYIWCDCNGGKNVARIKYEAGKTYTNNGGKVFYQVPVCFGINNSTRILTGYTGQGISLFSIDELLSKGEKATSYFTFDKGAYQAGYIFQSIDTMGKYCYTYWTINDSDGNPKNCRVVVVDMTTDKKVYEGDIIPPAGRKVSEAEGLQVKKEADGSISVYAEICQYTEPKTLVFKIV